MLCTFSPFKNSNPASIPNIPPLPGLLSQEAPLLLRGVCVCVCVRWVRCVCCHSTPLSSVVTPCFRSDEVPAKSPPARDSVSISVSSGILRGVCVGGTIHTEFKSNHQKSVYVCPHYVQKIPNNVSDKILLLTYADHTPLVYYDVKQLWQAVGVP